MISEWSPGTWECSATDSFENQLNRLKEWNVIKLVKGGRVKRVSVKNVAKHYFIFLGLNLVGL